MKQMISRNRIVFGIILASIGLIGSVYGLFVYSSQIGIIEMCFTIPNALTHSNANACSKFQDFLTIGIIFISIGTMILIGGILLIVSGMKNWRTTGISK